MAIIALLAAIAVMAIYFAGHFGAFLPNDRPKSGFLLAFDTNIANYRAIMGCEWLCYHRP